MKALKSRREEEITQNEKKSDFYRKYNLRMEGFKLNRDNTKMFKLNRDNIKIFL